MVPKDRYNHNKRDPEMRKIYLAWKRKNQREQISRYLPPLPELKYNKAEEMKRRARARQG